MPGIFTIKTPAFLTGFKLVYQGGHHNVYCDGNVHVKTTGGFCNPSAEPQQRKRWSAFKCDCAAWLEKKN